MHWQLTCESTEFLGELQSLQRQIPGGRENQCPDRTLWHVLLQLLEHGKEEGRRLARASPGHGHDVDAREYEGHRLPLDRSGDSIALPLDSIVDIGAQPEGLESTRLRLLLKLLLAFQLRLRAHERRHWSRHCRVGYLSGSVPLTKKVKRNKPSLQVYFLQITFWPLNIDIFSYNYHQTLESTFDPNCSISNFSYMHATRFSFFLSFFKIKMLNSFDPKLNKDS